MNEITNFIDSLDLGFEPIEEGNGYVISLDNSDDFSSVYNKLFLNDDLEEDDQKLLEDVSYFVLYHLIFHFTTYIMSFFP